MAREKMPHVNKIAQENENYEEISTATLGDIQGVIGKLYRKYAEEVGTEKAIDIQNSAHKFAEFIMDSMNGGTMKWLDRNEVEQGYEFVSLMLGYSIVGFDMVFTFLMNLDSHGLLKKPSDGYEEDCNGGCPVCGSPNCKIVVAGDVDEPCICECEDCKEKWITN